jgi:hypothetical protein
MPARNPVRELITRALSDQAPGGSYQDRYELFEPFRHRPVLQADLDPSTINQAAVRLLTGASREWSIAGTNAANAGSLLATGGGISLTTTTTGNDQVLLQPATSINSVAQSPFLTAGWTTDSEPRFEAIIELPALTAIRVKVALALTNAANRTTDDNQVGFMFDTAGSVSTANWTAITSISGTDAEADTGVAALAAKSIRLGVAVSSTRVPRFYINGVKVHTGSALTTAITLLPFIGVQTLTTAAKVVNVRGVRISRLLTPRS